MKATLLLCSETNLPFDTVTKFAEKATFVRLIKNVSACGGQGARKRPKAAPAVKFLPEDGPNGLSRGIRHGGQMGVFQQPAKQIFRLIQLLRRYFRSDRIGADIGIAHFNKEISVLAP
ncbi:MAG: hypothetical protein NT096_04795 [Proteobacteria bacterium]|nr:hypothetical protein [Pseudomonadota bacterium]